MKKLSVLPVFAALALSACAVQSTHPSLQQGRLPELIPVREFVADIKSNWGYSVSPDGKKLAWMAVQGTHPALMVKTIGGDQVKVFSILPRGFQWAGDSKHLLVFADKGGDENAHILSAAVDGPGTELTDLTPFENTRAHVVRVMDDGRSVVAIINRRDKKIFDVVSIDLPTGRHTTIAANPGGIAMWGVSPQGKLLARVAQSGERRRLEVLQESVPGDAMQNWKTTAEWTVFDSVHLVEFSEDGKSAWALSNRGRDKAALVKVDLASGVETVLYAAPDVDVERVYFSKNRQAPLVAWSAPDYPHQEVFDPALRQRLLALADGKPAAIHIESADRQDRMMTLAVSSDRGVRHYLYDAESQRIDLLGEDSLSRLAPQLASVKPIAFTSRDGLALHGYLTLPAGVKPENLPLVLLVHGGPWARDHWGASRMPQFLANRGYAVLQVNFRGSAGYGRAFMEKAIGEFAGKMHDDLIDGVSWAVRSGIADPKRIAIYGGSYGGYASLVGLAFTPEVFACGVDMVGPSDFARTLETAPPYWEMGMPLWHRYLGDPSNPEQRKVIDSKSPLFKADAITKPLLIMHGVNDPRVKLEQSELMAAALKKAGKQFEYVTFADDGHGNQRWPNNLTMYRKSEDFLAQCLGGRSSGFDYYQLGSWAF